MRAAVRQQPKVQLHRAALYLVCALTWSCSGGVAEIITPPEPVYVAGQSYFGEKNYVEYLAGNAPIIVSVPHGGTLTPTTIPDRTSASCGGEVLTGNDLLTRELARAVQQQYFARFGKYPHVILANIARRKVDLNRRPPLATCGSVEADKAYAEWHKFIDTAKQTALREYGKGFYIDLHGHGHAIPRVELGYLLTSAELDLSDVALNAAQRYEDDAGVRTISQASTASFAALLRGPNSLGTLYENNGIPAVPSARSPSPLGAEYFDGGDNTRRHSCGSDAASFGGVSGGNICGVQIETNFIGIRDTPANLDKFARATAIVLEQFLQVHWNLRLAP